jgi:hypothetical protein
LGKLIAAPAVGLRAADGAGQTGGQRGHDLRIVAAAAGDDQLGGRLAQHLEGQADAFGREGHERRGGVLQAEIVEGGEREVVAVQRLGRRGREIGVAQHAAQHRLVHPPGGGQAAAVVEAAGAPGLDQQVDHAVAGAGVEGGDLAARADEGDVGHAADVEHGQRRLQPRGLGPGQVVDRGQRRALPAGRHIRRAEVVGHRDAGLLRQPRPVAELHRAAGDAGLGPLVQHRLAVHADQVDVGPDQAVGGQEAFGGGQVLLGPGAGGLGEDRGLRRATRPLQGLVGGLQHEVADGIAQLALAGRAEGGDGLAVGLQHRHVDGVEGGSGHESEHAHAA